MPELPEVEAVCGGLRARARGARIVRMRVERPVVARPRDSGRIEREVAGCVLEDVGSRGKNILPRLSGERVVHIHLRMTGNLYAVPDARFLPSGTRAWWRMEDGRILVFEDSRALGKVHLCSGVGKDARERGRGTVIGGVHRGVVHRRGAAFAQARQTLSHGPAACRRAGQYLRRRGAVPGAYPSRAARQ